MPHHPHLGLAAIRETVAARRATFVSSLSRIGRLLLPAAIAVLAAVRVPTVHGESFAGKIGVELDGPIGLVFVDAARSLRGFEALNGGPVPKDHFGWPLADARTVIFDYRPVPAWAPPIDDPEQRQIDVSGVYKMSFTGQATLGAAEAPENWSIAHQTYDRAHNTTTADLTLDKGKALVFITFTHTRRTPDAPEGTGIANLKLIRPGYPADTQQTFTTPFLNALKPFAVLRMMDMTYTNDHAPHNGFYPQTIRWEDRKQPADATQMVDMGRQGVAWEYVIELANTTGKDIWINVPAEADDAFVRSLATLLHAGLKPSIKVYIEHSNEVWNWIFYQAVYNKMACDADLATGHSNLNNDGKSDTETVRARRHARRLIEITNIFLDVWGKAELNQRIRPVLAWWVIQPDEYAQTLAWVEKTYGPPKDHFYAIASGGYFDAQRAPNGNVDQLLATMRADCDEVSGYWKRLDGVAAKYGLKYMIYEGGPDNGGGSTANIANRIRANRDPRMGDIVKYHIQHGWFGGPADRDLFMYFSLCGPYSRHGCFGATDDITDLTTPKYKALLDLTAP